MAGTAPTASQGSRDRGDARSVFPRQCGGLDFRARPRPRHSISRQLLLVVGAKAGTAGPGGKGGIETQKDARARVGMDQNVAEGAAIEGQSPPESLRRVSQSKGRSAHR